MYDIIVIGGGPVGMYTAYYSGLRGLKTLIIDSLGQLGGQLSALYPEKNIYDLPGHPEIKAKDFIKNLELQLNRVSEFVDIALNQNVHDIQKQEENLFAVKTTNDNYLTKTVVISAGGGAFSPRKMEVEHEDEYTNIHYFVNDMEKFRNRRVAIFGGGDSAVDWSMMLLPIAKEVSIIHRRNEFRAKEVNVEAMKTSPVQVLTPYVPLSLDGSDKLATAITIQNVEDESKKIIPIDDIIVNFGFVSSLGPIENWGIKIEKKKIVVGAMFQTNIPGIFACGDICTYPGREAQITTGFSEGLIISAAAQKIAQPNSKARPIR